MSSTSQNLLLAALAVGVAGIYASLALRRSATSRAPSEGDPGTAEAPADDSLLVEAASLSEGLFDVGQWRGKPVLRDLDGDGRCDLVAAVRRWDSETKGDGLFVWLGDGGKSWTPAIEGLRRDMGYGGARVADVDGDGHQDLVYSGHDVMPQVFLGDGQGGWRASSEGLAMDGPCADVAVGDVDGDGVIELAALGQFAENGGLRVFRRAQDGWELVEELLDRWSFGAQVRLEDVDGDGRDELLAATEGGLRVWSFADGVFVDRSAGLEAPEIGGSDLAVVACDLDGDGAKELLLGGMIYDGHAPLRCFRFDGEVWAEWGSGLPVDEAVFDLELGDVDGDGDLEVVAAGKNGVAIVEHRGEGRFERVARVADTLAVVHLATGDVDGDGRDEIVCVFLDQDKGVRVLSLARAFGGTV